MGAVQVFFGLALLICVSFADALASAPPRECIACHDAHTHHASLPSDSLPLHVADTIVWSTLADTPLALHSVSFTPSATSIVVRFTSPTSQPVASSATSTCALLLSESTVAALGTAPSCWWRSPEALTVELGDGFALRNGTTVEVNGGVINAASSSAKYFPDVAAVSLESSSSTLPASSAPALLPPTLFPPSAVITSPSHASLCSPLTLSARASSGAAGLLWEVISAQSPDEAAAMSAFLDSLQTESEVPTVTFPAALFGGVEGARTFRLTVTAWHGKEASVETTVTLHEPASAPTASGGLVGLPTVVVVGPRALTATVGRDVFISADVTPPMPCPCAAGATDCTQQQQQQQQQQQELWSVRSQWELVSAPAHVALDSVVFQGGRRADGDQEGWSSQSLYVPAFSLESTATGEEYVFRITATATSGGVSLEASDEVRIAVIPARPQAVITGAAGAGTEQVTVGSSRWHFPAAAFLELVGSHSWDPNTPPPENSIPNSPLPAEAAVSHRWSCLPLSTASGSAECVSATDAAAVDWGAPVLRVPSEVLARMAALARGATESDPSEAAELLFALVTSITLAGGVVVESDPAIVSVLVPPNESSDDSFSMTLMSSLTNAAPQTIAAVGGADVPVTLTVTASPATAAAAAAAEATEGGPVVLWSVASANLDLSADETGALLPPEAPGMALVRASNSSCSHEGECTLMSQLTLLSSKLTPGVEYRFRASLFSSLAAAASAAPIALAEVSVALPSPPRGGSCQSESSPESATTTTVTCSNWVSLAGGALQYQWFALSLSPLLTDKDAEAWISLSPPLPRPWLSVPSALLLPGPSADRRWVRVVVTDPATGASSTEDVSVQVSSSSVALSTRALLILVAPAAASKAAAAAAEAAATAALTIAAWATEMGSYTVATLALLQAIDVIATAPASLKEAQEASLRLALLNHVAAAMPLLAEGQAAVRAATLPAPPLAPAVKLADEERPTISAAVPVLLALSAGSTRALSPSHPPSSDAISGRELALRLLLPHTATLSSQAMLSPLAARAGDALAAAAARAWAAAAEKLDVEEVALPAAGKQARGRAQTAAAVAASEARAMVRLLQGQAAVSASAASAATPVGGSPASVGPVTTTVAFARALPASLTSPPLSTGSAAQATATIGLPRAALVLAAEAAGADAVELVLTVIREPRLLLFAGMEPGDFFDEADTSPIVTLDVFARVSTEGSSNMVTAPVTLSEGVMVPLRQQLPVLAPLSFETGSNRLHVTANEDDGESFEVTLPHSKLPDTSTAACQVWSFAPLSSDSSGEASDRGWSSEGCSAPDISSARTSSTCRCSRPGVYRVTIHHFVPRVNRLRPGDWRNLTAKNIREHSVPLIVLCVWFAVFMIFLYIASRIDRIKDTRALLHYHAEWRPDAAAAARGTVSAEATREEEYRASFCTVYWRYVGYAVRHTHMWCSAVLRDDANPFSSSGRITAAFILILTSFMINAVFFGTKIGLKTIAKSLCAAVIVLPVGTLMTYLLNTTQQGRLKLAIYGYAEHVAFLHYTGRWRDARYASRTEHQLRPNPALGAEDIPPLLASVARSAGWAHGPDGVTVSSGERNKEELRQKLRLLVHVDFDAFLYWYYDWSWRSVIPTGVRLLGYALLWAWIIVCALLILVYGIQFDLMKHSNTRKWLRVSGIAIAIDIFGFKFIAILLRMLIGLAITRCRGPSKRGCMPRRGTDDDDLTVVESWEGYDDDTAASGGVGKLSFAKKLDLDGEAPHTTTSFNDDAHTGAVLVELAPLAAAPSSPSASPNADAESSSAVGKSNIRDHTPPADDASLDTANMA